MTTRSDVRPSQINYQLLRAMLVLGEAWDSAEEAPLEATVALEHIQTAMNLVSNPEQSVDEAQPRDPGWPVTFRHLNPELSRAAAIDRDMTAWSLDAIRRLLSSGEFALLCEVADRRALCFWADDELVVFTDHPKAPWTQCHPAAIVDWIGAAAPKEPGAEPLLVHREELTGSLRDPIDRAEEADRDA